MLRKEVCYTSMFYNYRMTNTMLGKPQTRIFDSIITLQATALNGRDFISR